ncbi:conjugal transfer protein TraK [Flagellimonas nanhaiensis]|uniref:Conjugal transfer protein TraK n=1 Tax=Flagellimonas nanhaiensis TaxID=2292706 RepID=A0A371JLN5_9FLAO|nr:conjugal transfer protein TraK [Allomuricauda nanhaiensis]RDY57921.1 conjugal transfer protein TraK [Allomuricauda nanhaiensis]
MKATYKNITEILRLNRFVVIAVTTLCLLTSGFSLWTAHRAQRTLLESAFAVNTDGSVIPLKLVEQRENLEVEARSHLQLFHQYFYGIDESNFERNLEKALWLGDGSVDEAYRQKRADGVYNRLLQYSLVQNIINIAIELEITKGGNASFEVETLFEIDRGAVTDQYRLVTTGKLINVDRHFPNNTHGLLITEFFEKSLQKLENEDKTN